MESCAGGLGNSVVEVLALDGGNLQLLGGGLAATVRAGEGAGAPGAATVDLAEVSQLGEGLCVAERHVDETVVGECGDGSQSSRLLATTQTGSGDEDADVLAPEATSGPLLARAVPESLVEATMLAIFQV